MQGRRPRHLEAYCRGTGTSRKPRWPARPSPKSEQLNKPQEEWKEGWEEGQRGYKRAGRTSLSPIDVPQWDSSRHFESDDKEKLVRRRLFVDACRRLPGIFVATVGQDQRHRTLRCCRTKICICCSSGTRLVARDLSLPVDQIFYSR